MSRGFIVWLLSIWTFVGAAHNAAHDFDVLSKMSSDELMSIGRQFFEAYQPDKALIYFQTVGERYQEDDSRESVLSSIRALNNCGCVYKFYYYDYPQAYEYFTRAHELCERVGDESFLPVILVNLGDLLSDYSAIYNSERIKHQADSLLNISINKAIETKNWELLTTAFFNLANNNHQLDINKYKCLFSHEIPASTPDLQYVRLLYKGIEALQQKRYSEARNYFKRQPAVVTTRWQPKRDTLATYINIAETYRLEKDYCNAGVYLEKALSMTYDEEFLDISANICKLLSECYSQLGDEVQAQKFRTFYLEKMAAIHNTRLSHVGELKYLSDLRKEETKVRELIMRRRIHRIINILIGVILVIVCFVIYILLRLNRRLHARNKSLFEKYQQYVQEEQKGKESKYSHSNLNDSHRESLIERIKEILEDSSIICRQGFSVKELANMVDSNTTYVSQVINETYGISFSILLGNYRVREACRKINDNREFVNLTIEGIANCVGFKSRTAFLNAFKREVGISPSEYIRLARAAR